MIETQPSFQDAMAKAEAIATHEFAQFNLVRNEGGRAACQDDWRTFKQMRVSQFLTWPMPLMDSYAADLKAADAAGRNLLMEKYARMMSSAEPERYAREIEPFLPVLAASRVEAQERIIAVQVEWAREFHERFPRLGAGMRRLRSSQDTVDDTSFETYLRGELGTYSDATLALYGELVDATAAAGGNLTAKTVGFTVAFAGFETLDAAEAAQRA